MTSRASSLSPAGFPAAGIADLSWAMLAGAALLFVAMLALIAWTLRRRRDEEAPVRERLWLVGGGIVLPVVVGLVLFVASVRVPTGMDGGAVAGELVVSVTGHDWWWEVRYRDPASGAEVVTANEIHVPAGRPVVLGLNSGDVIHSFWVPALAGKVDMVPGRVQQLRIEADAPGVHRGVCAEFCGEQHAKMAFEVIVHAEPDFARWLAAQRGPALAPLTDAAVRGMAVFAAERCSACHAVRGLFAGGGLGPDLTHVGGRRRLGAGTLAADEAGFARWVAHVQQVKPGARMPGYERLDADSLAALASFLAQLR